MLELIFESIAFGTILVGFLCLAFERKGGEK
jgi:hypothetical protein